MINTETRGRPSTGYGYKEVRKFDLRRWLSEARVYPYCSCGRKFVETKENQRECLYCISSNNR